MARLALLGLALLGCSDAQFTAAEASIAGTWTGTAKNESSSCPGDFRVGETSAVTATITQDGSRVSIKIDGNVGFFMNLFVGGDTFSGTVSGTKLDASLLGSKQLKEGLCTYKVTATMKGTVEASNKLSGTVTYTPNTVSGDCTLVRGCSRVQSFIMNKT